MSLSEYFMLALFILSVVSYIVLLFLRMHIINEVRREMNRMREEWKAEKYDRGGPLGISHTGDVVRCNPLHHER